MTVDEAINNLKSLVERRVAEGFDSPEQIESGIADVADDEYPDIGLNDRIEAWVEDALLRARESERSWPPITDCDRLDRAFLLLEARGIVARQNFSCCQTCGNAEIEEEIEQAKSRGEIVGYTYFHMQDTESASEGHGLYLAFGGLAPGDEADVAVGQQIVAALRQCGLSPDWNESRAKRIAVPMTWQKRRWSKASVAVGPHAPGESKRWWQLWKS